MIREAELTDLPEISRMGAAFAKAAGLPADMQAILDTAEHMINTEGSVILITDGGMIGGIAYPHFFNNEVLIVQELFFWVDEDQRGNGRLLLDSFEDWAVGIGAHKVMMIALESQRPQAVGNLYKRRGYTCLEHTYQKVM